MLCQYSFVLYVSHVLYCVFFFIFFFFLLIRRPPRSTHCISSAASDVYKRQYQRRVHEHHKFTGRKLAIPLHGVTDIIQFPGGILMLALLIRQGRMTAGTPVGNVVRAVDQPFVVEPAEHFFHGFAQSRIHRETFTLPVTGGAQPFQLPDDRSAIFLFPFPHLADKSLTAKVMPRLSFLTKGAFHHILRGDTGMIRTSPCTLR
eukprot:TRINITY_DN14520_c0_g1_i1.p1 TRINITY_DN14520_c0_g1~~TRINITY_DN14520_c0_g1_i1.p1  ORF type:complete len:203 (+),score=16.23 TRINITY_DN14520_c0_g1_i1:55-663(+)